MLNVKVTEYDLDIEDKEWLMANVTEISIDTETTGLNPLIDKIRLIQIHANGKYFLVRIKDYSDPKNLLEILKNSNIKKIFHNAMFDVRFIIKNFKIDIDNVICTKIAAKLVQETSENSSLAKILPKFIGVNLDKSQQLSDWSSDNLSEAQILYALHDVKYLSELWRVLSNELNRKNTLIFANACFSFIPVQAKLENMGLENIFKY